MLNNLRDKLRWLDTPLFKVNLPQDEQRLRRLIYSTTTIATVLTAIGSVVLFGGMQEIPWAVTLSMSGIVWCVFMQIWLGVLSQKRDTTVFVHLRSKTLLGPGLVFLLLGTSVFSIQLALIYFDPIAGPPPGWQPIAVFALVPAFLLGLTATYSYTVFASLRHYRHACDTTTCTKCNYDLRGTTVPRCPECGSPTNNATPPPAPLPELPSSSV